MSPLRLVLLAALLLTACSSKPPWRAEYLQEVSGKATQDEVAQKLGPPTKTHPLKKGGEVWSYEVCVAGIAGMVAPSGCARYVLVFDEHGVLSSWVRQP